VDAFSSASVNAYPSVDEYAADVSTIFTGDAPDADQALDVYVDPLERPEAFAAPSQFVPLSPVRFGFAPAVGL
jgi:hypothetical protein